MMTVPRTWVNQKAQICSKKWYHRYFTSAAEIVLEVFPHYSDATRALIEEELQYLEFQDSYGVQARCLLESTKRTRAKLKSMIRPLAQVIEFAYFQTSSRIPGGS